IMDQIFAPEYFDTIFRFLPTNKDLHSCLLVNKRWLLVPFQFYGKLPSRLMARTFHLSK
ncbi:16812_t:CDS:1, partial [Racocetra persica]